MGMLTRESVVNEREEEMMRGVEVEEDVRTREERLAKFMEQAELDDFEEEEDMALEYDAEQEAMREEMELNEKLRKLQEKNREAECRKNLSISRDMANALDRVCKDNLAKLPDSVNKILEAYDSAFTFVNMTKDGRRKEIVNTLSEETLALEKALNVGVDYYRTRYVAVLQVLSNLIGDSNEPTYNPES